MMESLGPDTDSVRVLRHKQDTEIVLDFLERGVKFMKDDRLEQYTTLFYATRCKVYARFGDSSAMSMGSADGGLFPQSGGSQGTLDNLGVDGMQPFMFSQGGGIETYRNQVTGFLDAGVLDVDNMVAAWYNSIMDGNQPQRFNFGG